MNTQPKLLYDENQTYIFNKEATLETRDFLHNIEAQRQKYSLNNYGKLALIIFTFIGFITLCSASTVPEFVIHGFQETISGKRGIDAVLTAILVLLALPTMLYVVYISLYPLWISLKLLKNLKISVDCSYKSDNSRQAK